MPTPLPIPRRRAVKRRSTASTSLLLPLLVAAAALLTSLCVATPQAVAGTSKSGIVDQRLESVYGLGIFNLTPSGVSEIATEMGPDRLGARWTRVLVHWGRLQPSKPGASLADDANGDGYSDSYLQELDMVVKALQAEGLRVILTGIDVPKWASDSRYWPHKVYDPDTAMRIDDKTVRAQYTAFGRFLATHFGAMGVRHFEVWNEPNLGSGIFPQRVGKKLVGPVVYVKMLKAFYAGVKKGSRQAIVIAGGTAPRGANNEYSTAPQVFAKYLVKSGATKWFNAYSHHPYTPRGSRNAAPDRLPNNPQRCVTLANLGTLFSIIRSKPFFLTEYGYNTKDSELFGLQVTREQQATYLTKAYSMVASMPRVKVLLWYLIPDWQPDPAHPTQGAYCGLVGLDGLRKPGWYAFAGGNSVAVTQPSSATAGVPFDVGGTLQGRVPVDPGQVVLLQRRTAAGATWQTIAQSESSADGAFTFSGVTQTATQTYRVAWDGLAQSEQFTVKTP